MFHRNGTLNLYTYGKLRKFNVIVNYKFTYCISTVNSLGFMSVFLITSQGFSSLG